MTLAPRGVAQSYASHPAPAPVAKRRFRVLDERTPDELTPEERRERRREERKRSDHGKRPKTPATGWRRAVVPGAVAGVIVAVLLLIAYGSGVLFQPPCLQFQSIPESSGIPAFPAANTTGTGFSTTWCPGAPPVYQTYPRLSIVIGGGSVGLPPSIGVSSNFSAYTCTLPIHTTAASAGLAPGTISIQSPWPYDYTLGEFFQVWQGSYVSAYVNASYSTRTIDYTATSLLGLPADASHTLTLYVDNQPSNSGPSLVLNTLDASAPTFPSCLGKIYGSGHTIELVYRAAGATAGGGGLHGPVLATSAAAAPDGSLGASPGPRADLGPAAALQRQDAGVGQLVWLALRPV